MNELGGLKAKLLEPRVEFSLPGARQYIENVLAFQDIDTRERFHKRFFFEFLPLVTIAESVASPNARIIFSGSGPNIDAELLLDHTLPPRRVEMTAAIDGHQEALRMEHLAIYGHVPITERMTATGIRHRKDRHIQETHAEWRSAEESDNALGERIRQALQAKQQMAVHRPHYLDAWLGVVVPDYPPTEYKKRRFDPLCAKLFIDPAVFAPFSRVFVVSTVGDYIFDTGPDRSQTWST